MPTDLELWTQFCRGGTEAFDAFYRRHASRLQGYLQHMVSNRAAAEDVMQETFAQIWRKPNGFQPERGTLRAYLYGIARKCAVEWWRTQLPDSEVPASVSVHSKAEIVSEIDDALQRLPEEQRTLLWLREVEGHSYAELAQMLGVPTGTIRSRLFAAREALRGIWCSRAEKEGA